MKFTKEMQERICAWVELNGLQPQPCGATRASLCAAMGITHTTLDRWEKNVQFVQALSRARDVFASKTVLTLENALLRAANGAERKKIREKAKAEPIVIIAPDGTRTERLGELKTVDAYRETLTLPPDVKALQFALTNMAPNKWRNKQEATIDAQGLQINLTTASDAVDGLKHAFETGAQPRPPKDEEEAE